MPSLLSVLGFNPLALSIAADTRLVDDELDRLAERAADDDLREALRALFRSGGKRLRPALVLLSAHWGTYNRARAIVAGAAMEMIHAASLIHDDIIDRASTRRGTPTTNSVYGNKVAVLSGDYLFAAAAGAVASMNDVALMAATAQTIMSLCAGEIAQSARAFDWQLSEDEYLGYLEQKTASLTWLCCRAGAMVAGASERVVDGLSDIGRALGMAFQIVDDVLDITAGADELGKPAGLDLREGMLTLPVIHFLRSPAGQPFKARLCQGKPADEQTVQDLLLAVRSNGSVDYAYDRARSYLQQVEQRVAGLDSGDAGKTLVQVMRYAIDRRS